LGVPICAAEGIYMVRNLPLRPVADGPGVRRDQPRGRPRYMRSRCRRSSSAGDHGWGGFVRGQPPIAGRGVVLNASSDSTKRRVADQPQPGGAALAAPNSMKWAWFWVTVP